MKRLTLLSITIFLLTNIIFAQDIINETGKDGKFIVRDSEQQEALIVEDGNVAITGELSVEQMSEGKNTDAMVVWDKDDKNLKVVPRVFSRVSALSEPLDTGIGHSIIRGNSLGEDNNEISLSVQGTAAAWNQFDTDYGYIKLGPANAGWAHIYTDKDNFIFNKPLYSYQGDFSSYGGSNLRLQTHGTNRLTILASNGNVGLGTVIPGAKLDIYTGTNTNGILVRENTHGSITHNFYVDSFDNGQLILYADDQIPKVSINTVGNSYFNGGNVGIGTSSPTAVLELSSTASSTDYTPLVFGEAGLDVFQFDAKFSGSGVTNNWLNLHDWWGNDVMTWRNALVGIGTTNPAYKLDVAGPANLNDGTTGTFLRANGAEAAWYNNDYFSWGFDGNYNYFANQVLIGKTSSIWSSMFEVYGNNSEVNSFIALIRNTSTSTTADGLRITLEPTIPGSGNHFIEFVDNAGNSWAGWISGDGSGNVTYNTTSDARLKMNIVDYPSALDKVSKIRVRQYEMKSAPGKEQIGFLAQELQKVYPQAVSGDPTGDVDDEPMGIDYGRLTPLLVKAIQELQARIEVLER